MCNNVLEQIAVWDLPSSGTFRSLDLPTFRDNISVLHSRVKQHKQNQPLKIRPIFCPETSVTTKPDITQTAACLFRIPEHNTHFSFFFCPSYTFLFLSVLQLFFLSSLPMVVTWPSVVPSHSAFLPVHEHPCWYRVHSSSNHPQPCDSSPWTALRPGKVTSHAHAWEVTGASSRERQHANHNANQAPGRQSACCISKIVQQISTKFCTLSLH